MTFYPFNPNMLREQQSDAGVTTGRGHVAHYQCTPVAPDADGVHAAVTDTGSEQVITTALSNPDVPRNITATAGGTAGDIKAIQVIVEGTDFAGQPLTETLPAFTVNTAGIVTGTKAFKTVTEVTIPAHDGLGATTAIGWGSVLGLPDLLPFDAVLMAAYDSVREATPPTVTAHESTIALNTFELDTTLAGDVVDIVYLDL